MAMEHLKAAGLHDWAEELAAHLHGEREHEGEEREPKHEREHEEEEHNHNHAVRKLQEQVDELYQLIRKLQK